MQNRNSFWIISIVACLLIACINPSDSLAQGKKKDKKATTPLVTAADSFSYMIGIAVGYSLKNQKIEGINVNLISKGMGEVLANDSAVTMQEANMYLNKYFGQLRDKEGNDNLEKGKKFLEDNRKQPGVTETASGLQIKVLQEGTGRSPLETDRVRCHYIGRLINGDVFDSSYDRGQPAEFELQGVIKGWTEGLQLMKEGGKYELFIPSDLAYGSRGAGQSIGPNETLIFEIELLQVLDSTEETPYEEDEQGNN
jgi:FKBP-type peptidyl-prolyl cis-trans isomerase FklB